jgi:hypothetical protein
VNTAAAILLTHLTADTGCVIPADGVLLRSSDLKASFGMKIWAQ